jgi:tRNA(Ile)-lysidine synthase
MEKEGLDAKKIIKTVDNLFSADQALNFYKNKALYKHASFVSKNKCLINKKIFSEEAQEIIFKFFYDILPLVSGTYYPPRSKKVVNLINRLKSDKFAKSTLGGCIIEKKDNFILISKELKKRIKNKENVIPA